MVASVSKYTHQLCGLQADPGYMSDAHEASAADADSAREADVPVPPILQEQLQVASGRPATPPQQQDTVMEPADAGMPLWPRLHKHCGIPTLFAE